MNFDGWSAPREKTPRAKSSSGVRESPKNRALAEKKEDAGALKAAKASMRTPSLAPEKRTYSRKDLGSTSRAVIHRSNQSKREPPKAEPTTATPASHDETPVKRRNIPSGSDDERSHKRPKKPRSGRLIDALVDQAVESSDEEPEHPESPRTPQGPATPARQREISESPSLAPGRLVKPSSSVKVTYGAQRSILRVTRSPDPNGDMALLQPLETPLPSAPSGLDFSLPESDDDETPHKGAIRSIHELRQAGANDRFADEIDDLLDRVGSPRKDSLSLRRNALLEVAVKLHQKRFLRQFRDYGAGGKLFDGLGEEDDIICGFALVSALLTLLTANAAPRASKYLQSGISKLLRKLLRQADDISSIAGQRSMNMTRNGRSTIASLKSAMLKLDVWEKGVTTLTPRSLSLKFMSVAIGSSDGPTCARAFEGLADSLFSILRLVPEPGFPEECSEVEKADCAVVTTVLQELSIGAVASDHASGWTNEYPKTVSAALDATLQRHDRLSEPFEESLLKLAMNCTNNNPPAASVWHQTGRLGNVATSTCTCFNLVKDGVTKGKWNTAEYNRLLLILGLMINLCEHAPSSEFSLDTDVLDNLIRVYLGSYSSTREVRCEPMHRVMSHRTNLTSKPGRFCGEDTA